MRRFLKRLLLKSLNQTDAILNSFKLFYTLYFVHFILVITFINSYQGKKEKNDLFQYSCRCKKKVILFFRFVNV